MSSHADKPVHHSVHHSGAPVITRPAAADDVAAIVAIEEASFAHDGERFSGRKIRGLIANRRAIVIVAEKEQSDGQRKLIGWSAAIAAPHRPRPWGRIYAIAVDPHARGFKVGGLLLQTSIEALRARAVCRIFLEVRTDNASAIRLYHRFGFVRCQKLADYYAPGVDAQRMVLDFGKEQEKANKPQMNADERR